MVPYLMYSFVMTTGTAHARKTFSTNITRGSLWELGDVPINITWSIIIYIWVLRRCSKIWHGNIFGRGAELFLDFLYWSTGKSLWEAFILTIWRQIFHWITSSIHKNSKLRTWGEHEENILRTCCLHVLPLFSPCSELGIFMYWTRKSMNNLLSYCGLVDPRIRASEKVLPVTRCKSAKEEVLDFFIGFWWTTVICKHLSYFTKNWITKVVTKWEGAKKFPGAWFSVSFFYSWQLRKRHWKLCTRVVQIMYCPLKLKNWWQAQNFLII